MWPVATDGVAWSVSWSAGPSLRPLVAATVSQILLVAKPQLRKIHSSLAKAFSWPAAGSYFGSLQVYTSHVITL